MPILYRDAYDEVVEAMRASNDPGGKAKAHRRLNMDYQYIAQLDSWAKMRKFTELTYSGSPIQLPANLIGIDLVWDDIYEIEFLGRTRHDAEEIEYAYRYYTYPVGSTLATGDDVAINQDGTTFSSATLGALADAGTTFTDEWFYIDGEDQLYQISSRSGDLFTFSPAYRGIGNKTAAFIVVRPPSTLMLSLVSAESTTLPTGTIDLHYWEQPNLLRDPTDEILLPTHDPLVLRSLSYLPEAKPRRPVTHSMVEEEIGRALAINPAPPRPRVTRGLHGRKLNMSHNLYSSRHLQSGYSNNVLERWQTQEQVGNYVRP